MGRELGVRYALEGSVQRGGERIRINFQLIDAQTGAHLWAERIDRDRSDLLKVQDEVSRRVAYLTTQQVIKTELFRGERERSCSPDSDELVLRANSPDLLGSQPEKYAAKIELFEQAARLNPGTTLHGRALPGAWQRAYSPDGS